MMESNVIRVCLLSLLFASRMLIIGAVATDGDFYSNSDSELVPLYLGEVEDDRVNDLENYKLFGTYIGIDLGNSSFRVGVERNGHLEIIPNDLGNTKTPNWISFTNSETLIGLSAKNQAALDPQATVFNIMQLLARKFDDPEVQRAIKVSPYKIMNREGKPHMEVMVRGGTKVFSPEEITALFLRKIKDMAENYLRKRIRKAILTVPACFGDEQRSATKKAAALAGFNEAQVFNHPLAAFHGHNLHNKRKNGLSNFLMFHLGGGTCEVNIVGHDNGVFEVLARNSDTHLGGRQFDQTLVNYFVDLIKSKYGRDVGQDKRALDKLLEECERAKISLSSHDQVVVEIESLFDGINFSEPLMRTKFEELNMDLFEKTMDLVEKALEQAGLKKVDVHDILLVGGSTRIPKVQTLLKDLFDGKEPNKDAHDVNPDEVLVKGALAIVEAIAKDQLGLDLFSPFVLPFSLGIETGGGVMMKLIPKKSCMPIRNRKKVFTTNRDNQSTVEIRVYRGEKRFVKDCLEIGRFNLSGILPARRGVPEIEIGIDIDENDNIHVKAKGQASNASASKTIYGVFFDYDSREERRMLEEAVEEEDRMCWLEKCQQDQVSI